MNRTWSLILIAAFVALVMAIWLPSRSAAHAASEQSFVLPEDAPHYDPGFVDNDAKPSPFSREGKPSLLTFPDR
jgi:hypothetical protein